VTPELPGVAAVLEAGRREGIAPALAACVLARGATVHASLHGEVEPASPGDGEGDRDRTRPLEAADVFDLASLTKVLVTTGVAAQLADEGRLELDAPAARYVPGFERGGKEGVTVRQLLAHASGLPAWRPYHEQAAREPGSSAAFLPPAERPAPDALAGAFERGRALVEEAVRAEPLETPPGTRALYSDVGFIALGLAVERAAGGTLAALADSRLFRPLGLHSTFFLDGTDPASARARASGRSFLPTGACPHRHEVNRGAVNDDNAWAMGGVAGHAGLFSTAEEVAAVGQAWLDALSGRPSIVPPRAARLFARRDETPGSDRALGWDTPGVGSAIGDRLGRGPRGAIGHLGYTGTSVWLDLDAELVCVLLTNHTHPSGVARRELIRDLRRRFHDAVGEALGI
jgi:CubicO group peptidase (beta-lactamase class C family)